MSAYRHEQQTVVVASARSAADAELIKITLAANGFHAVVAPRVPGYPSVDFVEGVDVSVNAGDAEGALEVLRRLNMAG